MSIPSWSHSPFLSSNDVMNSFDVEIVSCNSNPFLLSYNKDHHAHIFNFVDSCNSGTPAGLPNPPLMPTFFYFSTPADSQSRNRLPDAAPADKKNHKMIEKQRREEMKALFSALGSLLPDKSLTGKRTVSEQVVEAMHYVRHLHRKVKDLSAESEKMKANCDRNAKVAMEKFVVKAQEYPILKINSGSSSVQIWTNSLEHEIVYSDILLVLEGGGLEVVSAASSTINNRVYHTIHAKVLDHELRHLIRTNHTQNQNLQTAEARP